ncbi:hypothetical protein AMECASPLE_028320, partial [Ameca splendens]
SRDSKFNLWQWQAELAVPVAGCGSATVCRSCHRSCYSLPQGGMGFREDARRCQTGRKCLPRRLLLFLWKLMLIIGKWVVIIVNSVCGAATGSDANGHKAAMRVPEDATGCQRMPQTARRCQRFPSGPHSLRTSCYSQLLRWRRIFNFVISFSYRASLVTFMDEASEGAPDQCFCGFFCVFALSSQPTMSEGKGAELEPEDKLQGSGG